MTTSSILRIIRTHSVARVTAEVDTCRGCTTFSSRMLVTVPLRTLMPWCRFPLACMLTSSVTIWMGFSPAFSASVYGITSMASANALTQYCSSPGRVLAQSRSWRESSISGAPPPAMRKGRCTRQRTTQRASCRERSASSSTSLFDPRTTTVAVRPMFGIPVTLTSLEAPTDTSSTSSAWPSFSGFMWSMCAMGRQLSVLEMNSISSRSMSRTTRIFALAR
mmetsp:Transcript_15243/g.32842  ORF Transcript_15243/g.32842 Transcript_15243/m.32842 type:complete len:221 (-) Transcript_15243:1052-1714(-)